MGHHYVQYRQVWALEFRQAKRLPSVRCRQHLITEPGQRLARQFPDGVMILGQQDGFRALQILRYADVRSFPRGIMEDTLHHREVYMEQRALPRFAINVDESAMLPD